MDERIVEGTQGCSLTTPSLTRPLKSPRAAGLTRRDSRCSRKGPGQLLLQGGHARSLGGNSGRRVPPAGLGQRDLGAGRKVVGTQALFLSSESPPNAHLLIEATTAQKQAIVIPRDNGLTGHAPKIRRSSKEALGISLLREKLGDSTIDIELLRKRMDQLEAGLP